MLSHCNPISKLWRAERQCPGPQYSSGLLECKSRKYESIMLGGTPCKRSLQKERPPRKDKKEKAKSKLSTREKSLKQDLFTSCLQMWLIVFQLVTKIHSVPTGKSFLGFSTFRIENTPHWEGKASSLQTHSSFLFPTIICPCFQFLTRWKVFIALCKVLRSLYRMISVFCLNGRINANRVMSQ